MLNANLSPTIHGAMAWTLLLGFVAFTLAFVWMLAMRMRIETLSDALEGASLDLALDERWAEIGWSRTTSRFSPAGAAFGVSGNTGAVICAT